MEDSENKSEFKVRDKRRFSPEGESVGEATEETRTEAPSQKEPEQKPAPERAADSGNEEAYRPLDFTTFVISMANTALFQLGLIKAPDAEPMKDIIGARQTIDLLALIQEKTRGNLTEQEARILEETLFQLRMAFVEAAK